MNSAGTLYRLRDIVVAAAFLTAALPLLAAISLAILVFMGAPVFFRQTRPGLEGRPFTLIKFRTMAPGEGTGVHRITPLGGWLRRTSLDELPEFWNILRGDMSLVGPRPLLMEYLPRYRPEQRRRHAVRPGLTGWAQVHGRNAISWEKKFDLDLWYVDHRSLWLDTKILLMTLGHVVRGTGVNQSEQETMPLFSGSRREK